MSEQATWEEGLAEMVQTLNALADAVIEQHQEITRLRDRVAALEQVPTGQPKSLIYTGGLIG